MNDEDFNGIVAGLGDAIAFARGDEARGEVVAGPDVKAIREGSGLSQSAFARTYRFPVATLRDWEQRRRRPDTGSATLLRMIQADPKGVEGIMAKIG